MKGTNKQLYSTSPAFQRARLASFPANLYKSGNLTRYCQVLTDFNFITDKIQHPEFGVEALLDDYELMNLEAEGLNQGEYESQKKSLKLLQGALRLSAHVLSQDRTQLAEQLLGRMQGIDLPEIQQLLAQAKEKKTIWLRPVTTSLTPPGGKLLRTLSGHSGSVWRWLCWQMGSRRFLPHLTTR